MCFLHNCIYWGVFVYCMYLRLVCCIVCCTGFILQIIYMNPSPMPILLQFRVLWQHKTTQTSDIKCCFAVSTLQRRLEPPKRPDSIMRVWEFPTSLCAETELQDDTPKGFRSPVPAGFVSFVLVLIDECKLISIKLHLTVSLSQTYTEHWRHNLKCSQPTQKRIIAHFK